MLAILAGSFLLGVLMGVMGGLLGTGGGTVAIPALVLVLGYSQKLAQGTVLVMVVANVARALAQYRNRSGLDLRYAGTLAVSGSLSSWLSSYWAISLPGDLLQKFYGVFLLMLAGLALRTKDREPAQRTLSWRWAVLPGLVGGVSLGMFGVGGAMLAVPLLVMFHGQTQVRAQGLGLSLALPGCAITLLQYAAHDFIDWPTGIMLAAGGVLGVSYGVGLAHRIDSPSLTRLFSLFLLGVGVLMLI